MDLLEYLVHALFALKIVAQGWIVLALLLQIFLFSVTTMFTFGKHVNATLGSIEELADHVVVLAEEPGHFLDEKLGLSLSLFQVLIVVVHFLVKQRFHLLNVDVIAGIELVEVVSEETFVCRTVVRFLLVAL